MTESKNWNRTAERLRTYSKQWFPAEDEWPDTVREPLLNAADLCERMASGALVEREQFTREYNRADAMFRANAQFRAENEALRKRVAELETALQSSNYYIRQRDE